MHEEQLKPIENQEINSSLTPIVPVKEETKQINQTPQEILKELPSWNLEPPIEIKRGN